MKPAMLLMLVFSNVTAFSSPVLIENGAATGSIVTPDDATPTVLYAAKELATYVKRISGADVPTVRERQFEKGTRIDVGLTRRVRARLPDRFLDEDERIWLQSNPEGVAICGGSDRATLMAVYRFLETLGCRWLAPDVDSVPKRPTIALDELAIDSVPAFDMRTDIGRGAVCRPWGVKMGMNGFYTRDDVPVTGGGYYLPKQVPGCHAYARLMPPGKYFKTHPEWYPLIGGERVPTAFLGPQLCVTAPGLADEFARNVIKLFDDDPNLQVVSISPNDDTGWCECARCQELDEKLCGGRRTKQGLGSERPFRGDRVFWFANEVARRVAEKYPDKLLLVLAYINYAEPPDTIRPASHVVPWLCHYAPADYSRPINDPSSEPNKQFNALLQRWVKTAPDLLFYSYVSKSMWWRLPRPVLHTFASDIKYLHQLGVHRFYCQSSLTDWALDGPLYYVCAKLLWDPSADPDAIAADWTEHMFGPAAPAMARYYLAVERSVEKSKTSFSDSPPRDVPGLFEQAELDRALAALEEAAQLARTDSELAARVKKVDAVFRYGYHMVRCIDAAARFHQQPTKALVREAHEQGQKALSFCQVREAQRYLDSLRMIDVLGVIGTGFGEAMTLGGRQCWNSDETGPGDNRAGWAALAIETPDTSKSVRLEIDVWGTSQLHSIVVNTGGQRKSHSAGGIWNAVRPLKPLSGRKQWETLVFIISPEQLAKANTVQTIGFGNADSQVWIANVRVRMLDNKLMTRRQTFICPE